MNKTVHLLPLNDNEVMLIATALTAMIGAFDTDEFKRFVPPQFVNVKKKEAEQILSKIKKV